MCLCRFIASKLPYYELSGEVEADGIYFRGTRKEKRVLGASWEVVVFGLLKWDGKVLRLSYSTPRRNVPIIEENATPVSIVSTLVHGVQ
jgi:transposase